MILGRHSYFLGKNYGLGTKVGAFTSIGEDTLIHSPDNHACIKDHNLVTTYDFGMWRVDFCVPGWSKGEVEIGNDVWMGRGVEILSGVKVGDGAIVGAHTVIGKDVPPYAVIIGNPYQIKRFRYSPEIIDKLLKIKWWDWPDELIYQRMQDFKDINNFIQKYG
jgi:acetyltransferase-like isoleucine patch superfamily enzyme